MKKDNKAPNSQPPASKIFTEVQFTRGDIAPYTPRVGAPSFNVQDLKFAPIETQRQNCDTEKQAPTLQEAIAIIIAAGGTVIFGDKTTKA